MPEQTVTLTLPQAARVKQKIDAYNTARDEATALVGILVDGHVPEGSTVVSVNHETGALVMQTPT